MYCLFGALTKLRNLSFRKLKISGRGMDNFEFNLINLEFLLSSSIESYALF